LNLFAAFAELPIATSVVDFAAVALSSQRRDFLAKTADGSPVFLLHDASPPCYSPAIEFKNISVQFHTACRITTSSGSIEDQFAVVTCAERVPELHEVFVRCFAAAVEQLPPVSTTATLRRCIDELLNLFRTLGQPAVRQLTGLWGELFVISKCKDMSRALRAWHADPLERFDFSWGNGCLEVKASSRELREHEFALQQLHAPIAGAGFVASVLLQPMNGGMGVKDLADSIERSVAADPKLKEKLWKNIVWALGRDFSEQLDRRFDPSHAERSLVLYAMNDVPTPQSPDDPRITSVRFRVDLSAVSSSLHGSAKDVLQTLFV
jgi:hypothetical protein